MARAAFKKLSDDQRHIALRMYAEGIGPSDISKYIKSEWSIDYTPEGVSSLVKSKVHEPFLNKCRDEYLKKIKDVPIANKRIRIDDLEKVRNKVMKALEENKCATKTEREEFRQLVRTLNDIIINAREEMEKKPNLVPIIGLGDFSDKSDDDLIAERDELIKQAERLVSTGANETGSSLEGIEGSDTIESP